jgi:hypothetical protein
MDIMRKSSCLVYLSLVAILLTGALPAAGQSAPNEVALSGSTIAYGGRVYDAASNQTTYTYNVGGTGQRPAGSTFNVEIPACAPALLIVSAEPAAGVGLGFDEFTGIDGLKWPLAADAAQSGVFAVTFMGNVAEGTVQVAVKTGNYEIAQLPGPSCVTASLSVENYVSSDGVTWSDSDDIPGLQVETGAQVWFRFVVSNAGNVDLSGLVLTDSLYDLTGCTLPAVLAVNSVAECTVGPFAAAQGQHANLTTVTAVHGAETVSATDSASYYSGDLPLIEIEKLVAKNESDNWRETVRVRSGRSVSFKLSIANTGNVALTDLVLTDSVYSTSGCTLPAALAPGETFDCVIGPFSTGSDDLTNTATVTASFGELTVSDTDTASYTITAENDDDDGPIIVIEGPIEEIDVNIITIFDIDIEVDVNDPILRNIRIGDVIRVEGDMTGDGTTIVIVAVTIVIVDIDIVVVGAPSGPIFVPHGCKITGIGNNNPRLKCSNKGSKGSSRKSS